MTTIAARRVVCLDTAGTIGDWVAFEDGRILEVGRGDPPGPRVLSTDGVVLPGMIDAHVHLTTTGIYHSGLDLRECRSVESLLEIVERSVSKASSGWMIAGNFDPGRNADARMPTASELDRISTGKVLLVSRTDGHSCAVNSAGLSALGVAPDMPGFELDDKGQPTGVLSHRANYEARSRFFERLPDEEFASAQRTGCRVALQRGVTSVHEMAGGGEREMRVVMKNVGRYPIHVKPYLATMDFERVSGAHLDCI
ncbi:MAG: amidohydrolase family protein [Actinomycetota bacterium]